MPVRKELVLKNTKWKKLSSNILLKHPRLTVIEDEVELPTGHKTSYVYIDEVPGAVMIIAKRKDGKLLLQREYSYPPNKWLYQFPGGAIENNEDTKQSALRELAEEAGLQGNLEELGSFYVNNRRMKHKFLYF